MGTIGDQQHPDCCPSPRQHSRDSRDFDEEYKNEQLQPSSWDNIMDCRNRSKHEVFLKATAARCQWLLQQHGSSDDLEGELHPASFDVLSRMGDTTVLDIAPPWPAVLDEDRRRQIRDILLRRRNSVGAQSSTRSTRSEVLWADGRRPAELQWCVELQRMVDVLPSCESGSGVSSEDVGDSLSDDMVLPEEEVVPEEETAVRRKDLFPVQQVEVQLACGREAKEAGGTEGRVAAQVKLDQTKSDGELQKWNLTRNWKSAKVSL